jgi:hypothetical protein
VANQRTAVELVDTEAQLLASVLSDSCDRTGYNTALCFAA